MRHPHGPVQTCQAERAERFPLTGKRGPEPRMPQQEYRREGRVCHSPVWKRSGSWDNGADPLARSRHLFSGRVPFRYEK